MATPKKNKKDDATIANVVSKSNIQGSINAAAENLVDAFNNKKAASDSMKDLKRQLTEALEANPDYAKLTEREKELKRARKDLSDELSEIKKEKEAIAIETDEQKEYDDFAEEQNAKFEEVKENVIVQLSRDLADEGMIAEVQVKGSQLILVVARA